MKKCLNKDCIAKNLFSDDMVNCPYCHGRLAKSDGLTDPFLLDPLDRSESEDKKNITFIRSVWGGIECNGRIVEKDHHDLLYSRIHKLFNSLIRGEPYQLGHQTQEYVLRIEPVSDGYSGEYADFSLYGNYLGRLIVGDEVKIKAKDYGNRRVVQTIYNHETKSKIKPGLQISAGVFRISLIVFLLLLGMIGFEVSQFIKSGAAAELFAVIIDSAMTLIAWSAGIVIMLKSIFPKKRGRK